MRIRIHVASLLVVIAFAALGLGTAGGDGGGSSVDEAEPEDDLSPLEHVNRIEAELDEGEAHGRGPGAEAIAAAVQREVAPSDAVAVEVLPGEPRRILVLAQMDGYDLVTAREEQAGLMALHDAISGAADAHVAIGVKDGFGYAAVLTNGPREWPPAIDTDPGVDGRHILGRLYEVPDTPTAEEGAAPSDPGATAAPEGEFTAVARCDLREQLGLCEELDARYVSAMHGPTLESQCTEDHGGEWGSGACPTEGARREYCEESFEGGRARARYYADSGPTWQGPSEECAYRGESGLGTTQLVTP